MRTTLILLVLLLATSCQSTLADEELHRFPGPVHTLHLRQRSGDVQVTMAPRDDVRVMTRSHHIASEAPSVLLDMRDGTLEAGYTRETGIGSSSVDFVIELPSGVTEVVARGDSGDLELFDLVGDLDVRTVSGDISADALFATSTRIKTHSGDVELSFAAPPEWVSIETKSGDVELALPGSGWSVRVKTSSGDVEIEPGMEGDSTQRRIEITTVSGDVRVRRR